MRLCDGWKSKEHLVESTIYAEVANSIRDEDKLHLCHNCLLEFALQMNELKIDYIIGESENCCD